LNKCGQALAWPVRGGQNGIHGGRFGLVEFLGPDRKNMPAISAIFPQTELSQAVVRFL
jgi:hypothetical protein